MQSAKDNEPNSFDAWFVHGNDPMAALVYPQLHFWFSIKNSSKWCGFVKVETIINGVLTHLGLTDTEEGAVNQEVSFSKSIFTVAFMVGYQENQVIRVTVYDGDQMRLSQGYTVASIDIPISDICGGISNFALCRGDKQLGDLFVHTEVDKVTRVVKLFSPNPLISLNFSDTAPNEDKLRLERPYFNEKTFFYLFKLSCPNLLEYDKKALKQMSCYNLFVRILKGDTDDLSGKVDATKTLWKSRSLDSPPFKLKAHGLTFSHDDMTGCNDTRAKPSETACLLFELVIATKTGKEFPIGRCKLLLKPIVGLPTDGKQNFNEQLLPTMEITADQNEWNDLQGSDVDGLESDTNEVEDEFEGIGKESTQNTVDEYTPQTPVKTLKSSFYSFSTMNGSHKLSMFSLFSGNQSGSSSVDDNIVAMIKKLGKIQIKVRKQMSLQKVIGGNELYENRLHAIVEQLRDRWSTRMLQVFEDSVSRRRLEAIRYYHFLKRINQGWTFSGVILSDMYHPCLQNIVDQLYNRKGKSSHTVVTSSKSCKVLEATTLLFSTLQPFLHNREVTAIAGGWITLPLQRFSRFISSCEETELHNSMKTGNNKGKAGADYEDIDDFFIRQIGFPIAQEFLSCQGTSHMNELLLSLQMLRSLNNWILHHWTSPENESDGSEIDNVNYNTPIDGSLFCAPDCCDPNRIIRDWSKAVSGSSLYAQKPIYRDLTRFVQGFMEASGIYFPAQHLLDASLSKRNKQNIPQSISQLNHFRKNETRRIACYTGTDYKVDLSPSDLSYLNDLPKTSIVGKKERSYDLDTLYHLLNQGCTEKQLNIVSWVLGRSPPTSEQKKFRALIASQLTKEKLSSVLLIILAAEQRYDVSNTDKDMLSKIADPFADILNWYQDSVNMSNSSKENVSVSNSGTTGNPDIAYKTASNLEILPTNPERAKVAILHFVSWAEVMAKAYQRDDIARQRLKMRREQEDQRKNQAIKQLNSSPVDDIELSSGMEAEDSQLPTILSLKRVLMDIFSVEVAEKIIGQKVEDWWIDESNITIESESGKVDGSSVSHPLNNSHVDDLAMSLTISQSLDHANKQSLTDDHKSSSTGKINAQILAQMKHLMLGNENVCSDDGHSESTPSKQDNENSPHFSAQLKNIIEIKSFHELNKIKVRFDEEMLVLMRRQISDQLATFMLAYDYNDEEYQEYNGKLPPSHQ